MPSLPSVLLRSKLKAGLRRHSRFEGEKDDIHPTVVFVPGIGKCCIYLWTITHVDSADRPPDEYKIQLILPGQARNKRGSLNFDMTDHTFLLGYSPDYGVFVGWESLLHPNFAFSAAVQVKEDLLIEARRFGWAVAPPRHVAAGNEVRVAFTPGNLQHYLQISMAADRRSLAGSIREAWFLKKTPKVSMPVQGKQKVEEFVPTLRNRLNTSRLKRDSRFGPMVRWEYADSCALCSVKLNVVEGAHIIPINQEGSLDEKWNGIALCRNHHRLFDAYAFIIKPNLKVRLDNDTIEFFRECGKEKGLTTLLTPFDGRKIAKPKFYAGDKCSRNKMEKALSWREASAALR